MRYLPYKLFEAGFMDDIPKPFEAWDDRVDKIRVIIQDNLTPKLSINRRRSSYGIKHAIEKLMGVYVPNGYLIAAMVLEGYTYTRKRKNSLNCYFNVSHKALKALEKLTR